MSTLKVSSINNPSASAGGISIDSSGSLSGALPYPNRNLLYNGAMQVHQRGTITTGITTSGYYTADRWNLSHSNTIGTWTQSIENDAPMGSGFVKSLKMLCTTANATLDASDGFFLDQRLEGQDLQRIAKGTSSAQQLTLSFWVKSNVTGTYVTNLTDNDNLRQVGAQYTISAPATWEKKIITFPADTTGAFDNDNALSLSLRFWIVAGSDRSSGTFRTTWTSITTADLAVGQTNVSAATNNYWQITGVQLEVGPTATPFEFEPYQDTLQKCRRYYQSYNFCTGFTAQPGSSTTYVVAPVFFTTTLRATPVVVFTAPTSGTVGSIEQWGNTLRAVSGYNVSTTNLQYIILSAGITTGDTLQWHMTVNAEF